jgi:ABC-type glycerol-3-phosphate transport system substrate-binding protein
MKMKLKYFFRTIFIFITILVFISCQEKQFEPIPFPTSTAVDALIIPSSTENPAFINPENVDQTQGKIGSNLRIEFWHPWSGKMAEIITELVEAYNTKNPYLNEIISKSHSDLDTLFEDITELYEIGDAVPELIVSSSQSLQTWYSNGFSIREIDGLLQEFEKKYPEKDFPQIFPIFWNVDLYNSERIGIPVYESGQFLFYNQTWGEELGFNGYPQNTEDFREQACLAEQTNRFDLEIENNGTGGWLYSADSLSLLAWLKAYGGGELTNSRSQPILSEPKNIEAFQFLYDMYEEDCAWTGKQQLPHGYFSSRYALFYSGKMEDMMLQLKIDESNGNTDKWKMIPYPSPSDRPIVIVRGLSFAFTSEDDERAHAALDFVFWLLQPENQAVIIEETGVFPLTSDVIDMVDNDLDMFPIWLDSLQYLPYAQPEPKIKEWYAMEKVLEDAGWQLIQFTMQPERIGDIFTEAEKILEKRKEESE